MALDQFKKDDKFLMLALDHRGSFKKLINSEDPESVSYEAVSSLKGEIIKSVEDQFSAVLLDQEYGLAAFDKSKPFLLPLEKSGYTDQAGERLTEIGYKVSDLKNDGASGAKILLYFNPHLKTAKTQLETARQVLDECKQNNFPLFLEIVTYVSGSEDIKPLRAGLVLDSVRIFIESGIIPDVWKLEYPGNFEACREISKLVGDTPWILLTRGDSFETFSEELKEAIRAGAKGFLAGRALWQEVGGLEGEAKDKFLKEVLPTRFSEISKIVLGV
ncbi:MAG: DUF2090 domain-containing protein [Candidatus Daviesbacteria bacterium]|nr:DUF2090 domain-containing protein [Candidatus Daviesbacteria bacterium]